MKAFNIPTALVSTQMNAVANRYRIITLKKQTLENVEVFFNVFHLFSNLQFGLNPEAWRAEKEKLERIKQNPNKTFSDIVVFARQLRQHTQRYEWRKSCYEKLGNNEFWTSVPEGLRHKRQEWLKIASFSYYSSADIAYLAFNTLGCIENYILRSESEIKRFFSKNSSESVKLFSKFIIDTKKNLQAQQENMAKAMQARLQLAAKHIDLSYDDILLDFVDELSSEYDCIIRPSTIDRPNKKLSRNDFLRFHQYIDRYGDSETKSAFAKLPWIQQGIYYKNHSGNWLCRPFSLTNNIRIPRKPRWPRGLFKGQYARYKAFGDPHHQIGLYLQHQHAKKLCEQTPEAMHSNDLVQLQRIYHVITIEQERVRALTKPLNRFFQRKTLRILRTQIDNHKQQRREIILKQCDLLETTIRGRNNQLSERKLIHANHLLQTIKALDTSDLSEIEERLLLLSNTLKQISDEYFHRIVPAQHRIAEEIALFIANEQSSIPSLSVSIDAFDFKLFQPRTINTLLKTLDMLLEDNTTFPKTADQIQLLKSLRNVFTHQEEENDRPFISNFIKNQHYTLGETQVTNKPVIMPTAPELLLINAIETNQHEHLKQWEPELLLSKLQDYLRYLLNPNCKDPHYLAKLDRLKGFVLTLPTADWNKSIRRLCIAKTKINNIINELPEAIIALVDGETDQMPLLGELLDDIVKADLMPTNVKQTIIQLLDILTADDTPNFNLLEPSLKLGLFSLKALIAGRGTQKDHDNIAKYALQLQKSKQVTKAAENTHAFWHTHQITHTPETAHTQPSLHLT